MKKFLIAFTILLCSASSFSQVYNNEWIDYNKTYYKFKVGSTGLYRIPQSVLAAAGLGSVNVQDFQLWRNGVEVPVFTSVVSGLGTMTPSDYLEFFGRMNDGKEDTKLYKTDLLQMSDKWSLYTDTSAYFLTVNVAGANPVLNKRAVSALNNVAGNVLATEPYYMHTLSYAFKQTMNPGYGIYLGELVHEAAYETAEGWSSEEFSSAGTLNSDNSNLRLFSGGPLATLKVTVAGNTSTSRTVSVRINGVKVDSSSVSGFNIKRFNKTNVALSAFTGDAFNLAINHNGSAGDHLIVSDYQLTYPKQFNFDGQSMYYFELSDGTPKFLEIANFNYGANPVLYDTANNQRFAGVVAGGLVKFALPAATRTRKLVLFNTDVASVKNITSLTQRNFINYGLAGNQGDYMIISTPILFNDGSGVDNVELYRQYRSSPAGGGYTAKVYLIDQLTDQYAFGIKHHPAALRNFAAFALANFGASLKPKHFFIIGKGLNYNHFRRFESDRNIDKLAMIPTFGYPASDNLLTATRTTGYPTISTGRLSAVSGTEIGYYLNKVKQYELAQVSGSQTIANKAWMKNIVQLTGGLDDQNLSSLINGYMDGYNAIASDSLFGGDVLQFVKNSGKNTATGTNKTLDDVFKEGSTLMNYFGHSSPNSIEFNLDNPENYNNTGKYPMIIINGCNSGDLFAFDTLRSVNKGTLSEKFVFANNKGSIGYIASTHFGLPTELNYFNTTFYRNMSKTMYGSTVGEIMKATAQYLVTQYGYDYIALTHAEEITLHGDPAIKLNPQTAPDFAIEDSLVTFNPSVVGVADGQLTITSKVINLGKAINDSLTVRVQHKLPDNSIVTLGNYRIKAVLYLDSIISIINIHPIFHKGLNQIIVTIDPDNLIAELSEANNTITKSFNVTEDELKPIWPYEYSIINTQGINVFASTVNPTVGVKQYVMEMDTTSKFNSVSKISRLVADSGGVIKFLPGITFKDSTVYYWRTALGPVNASTNWHNSSFVYIAGSSDGFNQSHYFQYKNNDYKTMIIDSVTRKFEFENVARRLLIRTGLYPYYGYDQINVNVDNDQIDYYGCAYRSLQFVVYDPLTLKPWKNNNVNATTGRFGSKAVCDLVNGGRNFFEFPYDDSVYRRKAISFMDSIPAGYYVSITNLGLTGSNYFIDKWKADTINLGSGKSLWHKFHALGMHQIDSFTRNLPFLFVYKKGDPISFPVKQVIGATENTQISQTYFIDGKEIEGTVTTPWMGPAKQWFNFKWDETPIANSTTTRRFDIYGQDTSGTETFIKSVYNAKDTSIAFISASTYPYLRLKMYNKDDQHANATQLKYWRLNASEVPEGAVSPNMIFNCPDSLSVNDTLRFKVGFINASDVNFDSIKVRLKIIDMSGVVHTYNNLLNGKKLNPLNAKDSVVISYDIPLTGYFGQNQLVLEVNPDNDQSEQFHFNNFLYKNFYVLNAGVCSNSGIGFSAGTHVAGNAYQWQVNNGTGFVPLTAVAPYANIDGNTLSITNPPTNLYGYKFRSVITNNSVVSYGPEYVLKFAATWVGAVSTEWELPANWNCNTLPDDNTDVLVTSSAPNSPVVNTVGVAVCRSITVKPNASVTVNSAKKLEIKGPPKN